VWTAEHTAAFLAAVRDHPLYPMFHVIALLGLRRGEAVGLRWSDVDLEGRMVSVVRQVVERDGCGVGVPKTDASCRTLALDRGTVALLKWLRVECSVGWVFSHGQGERWSPSYVTRTFRRLVGESGLPPIRLHDLRHGAATLSLAAGNELRVVQALLGHASIVLTADTYTSVLPSLALQAADATAELVRRAGRSRGQRVRGHARSGGVRDGRTGSPSRAGGELRRAEAPRRLHAGCTYDQSLPT
jgi:integrase